LLLLFAFFALSRGTALSAGISIEPGQILIQNVPPGTSYDIFEKTGIELKVINLDTSTHSYSVFSAKPSEVSTRDWLKGYVEIPDPSWFYFEKNELTIGPNDTAHVKMYLKIPADEEYYNQHWTVAIPIEGAPGKGPVEIKLALYPHFLIETENKTPVKDKPYGLLGIEPSIALLKDGQLGKAIRTRVIIYNNDKINHVYRLSAVAPKLISETKKQEISPSPGYSWIPDVKWVKLNPGKLLGNFFPAKDIKVGAGKSSSFPIEVLIPQKDEYLGQKWEVIIMAEPKGQTLAGQAGFVRLRVETQSK